MSADEILTGDGASQGEIVGRNRRWPTTTVLAAHITRSTAELRQLLTAETGQA